MTTSPRTTPTFTVRSGLSNVRALFIAALCAFIVTAFLVDVQRGAGDASPAASVGTRT
jgi:hypothetical protein